MLENENNENAEVWGIAVASTITVVGLGVAGFILWWPVIAGTNTREMLFLYIASGVVVLAAIPVWIIFYLVITWLLT